MRRVLDQRQDRDSPRPQVPTGTIPPSIARHVLDAFGGADILPNGETSIDDTGRPLRAGRPTAPGHAASTLLDDDLGDRLRRVGRDLRTGDDARRLIGEHGRDVTALARAIVGQRLELRKQLVWRRGNPGNPFDPHVRLEGVVHNSDDHLRLSTEPAERTLADGTTRSTAPLGKRNGVALGRWFPGDHDGCQCEWVVRTVPTVVPDLGQPPQRTPEDAIIDKLLGAQL